MLDKARRFVDKSLASVLSVLMFALLVDVVWQVFSRYVLRDPSSFTDELARYLMIWVALLGAAYVTGQRMHLAIDLLVQRFSGRWPQVFTHLVIGFFAVFVLIIGGSRLVNITLELGQQSAALRIPLGYVYLVLPLSGGVILFYALSELGSTINQSQE